MFRKATNFSSCHESNCKEDDEERRIKAQIEMDCQLRKINGEANSSTLASKHKRVNFSCGKL